MSGRWEPGLTQAEVSAVTAIAYPVAALLFPERLG